MNTPHDSRRPVELIANRAINQAIRANEIRGGWVSLITVEQAHGLIVQALEFDRSGKS